MPDLNKADTQEIYNFIISFLREQGKRAIDVRGNCQYLTPAGNKCAIGCLFPEDFYDNGYEGLGLSDLILNEGSKETFEAAGFGKHVNFLAQAQLFHDSSYTWISPSTFDDAAKDLAKYFNLVYLPRDETNV